MSKTNWADFTPINEDGAPAPAPATDWSKFEPIKEASAARKLGDMGLSVAKGVVAVPEAAVGLADLVSGGRAGKFLENEGGAVGFRPKQAKEFLTSLQSDDLNSKRQQFQQADGVVDKFGVAVTNPSLIANTVAESIPLMGAGAVPARALLAAAPRVGAIGAGAIGEGLVGAGSSAEQIRQETEDGLLTGKQAALAGASGAATAAFGAAGGAVARRLGIADVDTALAQGTLSAGAATNKGLVRRTAEGALSEGVLEELPQSLSEQALQNIALDKPVTEGLADAGVMGVLAGGLMGGGAAALTRQQQAQGLPDPNAGQPPAQPPAPAGEQPPAPFVNPASLTGNDAAALLGGQGSGLTGAADPLRAVVKPSEAMGIDPDAGVLSRTAAEAVDGPASMEMAVRQAEAAIAPEDNPEAGAPADQPIPLEDRPTDELRMTLRNAQDPAIRKAVGEELRRRREAPATTPDLFAPDQGAANVSNTDAAGALAAGTGGRVGADAAGGGPDAGLLETDAEQRPAGTAAAPGPVVQEGDAAPVPGRDSDKALTKGPTQTKAKVGGLKELIARNKAKRETQTPAGRPGYDTPVEVDAAAFQRLFEQSSGEPLATKPEKLNAWRNGTARTNTAISPIEIGFSDSGRVAVNDGRHRIAVAAERGEKVTAFIDGKDAKRLQELLNVQDQPQAAAPEPAPAPAPEVQAPQAVGGDGAAQPGAAPAGNAGVEAAGVSAPAESEKAKWIKATIDKSRLNGAGGVQIAVAPNGGITFMGDPRSNKDGKALLANYEQALAAGATQKEIAEALKASKSAPTPSPTTTEPTDAPRSPEATQAVETKTEGREETALLSDSVSTEPNLEAAKALLARQKAATGNAVAEGKVRKELRDLAAKTPETDTKTMLALDTAATRLGMGEGKLKGLEFKKTEASAAPAVAAPAPDNKPDPAVREKLMAIAKRLGVAVNTANGGFKAGGGAVDIPAEDAQVEGALSPNHVAAHELAHAAMQKRGMSFQGHPIGKIKESFIPNWDALVAASKAFRPAVWASESLRIKNHARKPNEVIADAIGSVYLGLNDVSLLEPMMKGTGTTEFDLGLKDAPAVAAPAPTQQAQAPAEPSVAPAPALQPTVAQATHQDPGEKPEAATKGVVNDSLKTAAKNEDTKPSEMRKWLLAEIDKELLQAPDRADYDEAVKRMGEKDAISMYTGNGFLGKNAETGFITFDVPGDGKFKVRNSVRGLLEFRKTVNSSLGFKDGGQKTLKPEQNDGVQGGSGGQMAAVTNMIEEGDFEAARDYAEAVGIKLEDVKVPRGDMKPAWDKFLKDGTLPEQRRTSTEWSITNEQNPNGTWSKVGVLKRVADGAEYVATVRGDLDGTNAQYTLTKDGKETGKMTSRQPFSRALEMAEDAMPEANDKPAPSKAKDTGWNMAGTGYGGKRYTGRNITLADGREVVARIYENAGTYEEAEVKEGSKVLLRLTDRYRAQERVDAWLDRLMDKAPALDLMGFKMEPMDDDGSFRLLDGNMVVSVERTDTGLQARHRSAKSSPRLTDQQAVEWAANIRDESKKAQAAPAAQPAIPDGYKPAGEPFYRDGKLTQGYAPFDIGQRVTMKESGGQSGVIDLFTSPDKNGVFDGAMVKFDNGVEQIVKLNKLEAEAAPVAATGTRRDPTKVSMFNPYNDGDIVTIDGQDWTVKADTPGWYLATTGNWRGQHPTIRNVKAMADLIREVEQAAEAKPASAGRTYQSAYDAEVERMHELADKKGVPASGINDDLSASLASLTIGRGFNQSPDEFLSANPAQKGRRDAMVAWRNGQIDHKPGQSEWAKRREKAQPAAESDAPKLTQAEAKDLMEWQDLGQKDGIKTHILTFYESKADKDAKRGRMTVATVSKEVDSKTWVLESNGEKYAMLGFAKKRAEEAGMAKAVADGFVEPAATPMSKYDAEARAYGYQVAPDGKISKGDKALSPVVKEVRGRLRVEAPDGKLLFSGATTPEAFGEFLRSFWGAEKAGADDAPMFSRAKAKEIRNLVTLHNMSEANLEYSDSLGGMPVPSLGITKVDAPFSGFGNITLIGDKNLVDPEQGVPVFDRDAWTARFPTMNFKKPRRAKADAFYERMKAMTKGIGVDEGNFLSNLWESMVNASVTNPDKVADHFRTYDAARMAYARDVLERPIKVPMRAARLSSPAATDKQLQAYWKRNGSRLVELERELSGYDFSNTPEYKSFMAEIEGAVRRYAEASGKADRADSYVNMFLPDGQLGAGGFNNLRKDFEKVGTKEIDGLKLREAVRKVVPDNDPVYLKWVQNQVKPLFDAPTITVRGKEVEPTLENIVEAMTVGAVQGVEKSMTFGPGKLAAHLGKRFKSLSEIQAARDQVVSESAESEAKKATDALLDEFRTHVAQFFTFKDWRGNIDTWAANDSSMEALARAGKQALTDANIRFALTRKDFKGVDQRGVDLARQAIEALRNTATNYFEAKPQRAVRLNEFKGAVVPKDISPDSLAILEKNGVAVEFYGKADGAREKAIEKMAKRLDRQSGDVMFSFAGKKSLTHDDLSLEFAQDMVARGQDAEKVRQETGWFQGKDGKWRYEISDKDAFTKGTGTFGEVIMRWYNAGVQRTGDQLYKTTVGDVLHHPKLFAAYPALAGIEVQMTPARVRAKGRVMRTVINGKVVETVIQINEDLPANEWLSVMLHELQHGIQYAEGFATGGSPVEFAKDLPHGGYDNGFATYQRTAGEVEARNTQARQGMTDVERRDIPPRATADVPDGDVIVMFDGKVAENAPAPANIKAPVRRQAAVSPTAAEQIVGVITSRWANAPEVVVVESVQDPRVPEAVRRADAAQRSQGATGEPEGFWYGGKAYIVSGALDRPADVVRVLFHEVLGHYGLRGTFGADLKPILAQIATMRKSEVQAKATEYGLDMAIEADRLQAAEEVLAVMAQSNPQAGFVKRAIGAIRAWLRENIPGLENMRLTDNDIVTQFILPARRFVQQGPAARVGDGVLAMSRSAGDVTDTPAFRKWFGDSKVVDADGKPLMMYHGTRNDITAFDSSKVKVRFPNSEGFYFTSRPMHASVYADSIDNAVNNFDPVSPFAKTVADGANVMPAYVSLQNPKLITVSEWGTLESAVDGDGGARVRAARAAGHDGVIVTRKAGDAYDGQLVIAFRPEQIKSAIGNNGQFDPENPDIRFSRSPRELAGMATDQIKMTLTAPGKLSWWSKTVGTMYGLAERHPAFKPVFNAAQSFIDDVSYYATDAADMAPKMLPKLENWRDIAKSPISAEDNKAIEPPINEGTLLWARDESGRPVKVAELEAQAADMTADQKARRLLRNDKISEGVLRMWQGLPQEQYEKLIDTRYQSQMLAPGLVWTAAELKAIWKLNDAQIGLYREVRAAIDKSLDNLAKSDLVRFVGKDGAGIKDAIMEAGTVDEAALMARDYFIGLSEAEPDRAEMLLATANGVMDRADKVTRLKAQGYAPLSRFGKYTVDVVTEEGRQYFGLFESMREANQMAARMRGEFGKDAVSQGTLSDESFKLFQGITPETLELFGNMLGLSDTGDTPQDQAFQAYLKLTKNNRSAMKRLIQRKGILGYSQDVGRVLANFIYSNARQTAGALHIGDLTDAINAIPQGQGEVKDVAVKLGEYIKNPQEEAQAFRGLLFAQYLGGNISSAIINALQPLQVSFPYLSQFGGVKQAGAEMLRATREYASGKKNFEPDLAQALKNAEDDGTVSPQEVFQLMAQAKGAGSLRSGDGTVRGELLAKGGNAWSKTAMAWGKVFGVAEQFNRRSTFIAAYRIAKAQKMADPAAFAKKAVQETQFIYSKANRPQWARGAIGATVFTFKIYSISYIELLHRMATQGGPEGKRAALLAVAVLLLMGGAGGLPFMEDGEDIADTIAQIMGYNFSSKQAKQELLEELFGEAAAQFIDRGISGVAGVPIDVSGRFGMGNLIPGTGAFLQRNSNARDVLEVLGPAGDLLQRGKDSFMALAKGNVYEAGLNMSPVAIRNLAKGADMAATDMYRDNKGFKVIETTGAEAGLKAIGFQPNTVAKVQEANYLMQRQKDYYNATAQSIRAKWARGLFEQDEGMVAEAREAIDAWNEKNPDQRMSPNMPAIWRRVREMAKDKDQRIADTAPKAMRAQFREETARVREAL